MGKNILKKGVTHGVKEGGVDVLLGSPGEIHDELDLLLLLAALSRGAARGLQLSCLFKHLKIKSGKWTRPRFGAEN